MSAIDLRKSQLTGLAIVAFVFGMVYSLDTLRIPWRRAAYQTFNTRPYLLFTFTLPIIFAILSIALVWLLLVHFEPTWLISTVCLLTGAFILAVGFTIALPLPSLSWFWNSPAVIGLLGRILELGEGSLTLQAGGFFLVIGLTNLARKLAAMRKAAQPTLV